MKARERTTFPIAKQKDLVILVALGIEFSKCNALAVGIITFRLKVYLIALTIDKIQPQKDLTDSR